MTLEEYMRELFLMKRQYGQEEELYPLVNMLLRENDNVKYLSVRDVHGPQGARFKKEMLIGYASKPDLVILSENYNPQKLYKLENIKKFLDVKNWRKNNNEKDKALNNCSVPENKKNEIISESELMYGCVEVKTEISFREDLLKKDMELIKVLSKDNIDKALDHGSGEQYQFLGELLWYGRELYTNGLKWYYLEIKENIKEIRNKYIGNFFPLKNGEYAGNIQKEDQIKVMCVEIGDLSKPYEVLIESNPVDLGELRKKFYLRDQETCEWIKKWKRLKYNLACINWTGNNEYDQFISKEDIEKNDENATTQDNNP